jgi:hypothetical protein
VLAGVALAAAAHRDGSTINEAGLLAGALEGNRRHSTVLSLVPTPHMVEQLPHSPALNEKEQSAKLVHACVAGGLLSDWHSSSPASLPDAAAHQTRLHCVPDPHVVLQFSNSPTFQPVGQRCPFVSSSSHSSACFNGGQS